MLGKVYGASAQQSGQTVGYSGGERGRGWVGCVDASAGAIRA